MLLRVQHETKLSYSEPVSETVFDVRMAPPSDEDQTNLGYRLRIVPSAPVTIYRDGFGNRVDLFNIITPYSELIIRATSIVRTHRGAAPESRLEETSCEAFFAEPMAIDALEYLQPSPLVSSSSSPRSKNPRAV
jgi:transglutaminase-like putative cysteine protease